MALGLNRQNDTPIGGLPEFRGNLQGGDVFNVGEIPVFDGEKFAPGVNVALVLGYGGLAVASSVLRVADGTLIADWDVVMPLSSVPLQMTPDPVTGIITVDQAGVYQIDFQCNIQNMDNNKDYFFELIDTNGTTGLGSHIVGSNNVSSQSTGFTLMTTGAAAGQIAIGSNSLDNSGYDIVSMTFICTRIG